MVTGPEKIPVVPATVFTLTAWAMMSGFAARPQTVPRAVIVAPPSLATLPPSVAVVSVTEAKVGVFTVGGEAGVVVVNVVSAE